METLNARRDLTTSWSSAQKKKVAKRNLEKRDEDFKKLLSSDKLFKICHGKMLMPLNSSGHHQSTLMVEEMFQRFSVISHTVKCVIGSSLAF